MKKMFILVLTLVFILGMSSISFASGTVFVGKGDVQSALGWNNKQLQDNANGLKWTYEISETYEITVEWTTGEGTRGEKTHVVTHERTVNVNSAVTYQARQQNQVTGFYLTIGDTPTTGNIPEVGDTFPGNSGHTVTSVELLSRTATLKVDGVPLN